MPTNSKSIRIKPNTTELLVNNATSIHTIVASKNTLNTFMIDATGLRLPIPADVLQFNNALAVSGDVSIVNEGNYQADVTIQFETA